MKKILSIFGMLMVFSSVVFARSIEPIKPTGMAIVKDGETFKLYYKGAEQMDVKISIHDETNNIVFSEMLKKVDGFLRPYNFSNLPEGKYTIEIADKNGSQIEAIQYQQDKIEQLAHLSKVSGSQKYVLTVPNRNQSDITVKIFDSSNNVIYSKKEEAPSDFGKVYNLEKFSGEFLFEITDGSGNTSTLIY